MEQPRGKGKVRIDLGFRSEEMRRAVLPVKVYRPDSTLIAEGVSSAALELDAGTYYVTVQLPAGQELSAKVEVAADSSELVMLSPYHVGEQPHGAQQEEVGRFLGGQTFDIRSGAGPRDADDRRYRLTDGPKGRRSLPGRLRFFDGNVLAGECELVGEPKLKTEHLGSELRCTPEGSVSILQLLQPGLEPLNVAVPAGKFGRCFFYLRKHEDAYYSADVHLSDATADCFTRYVEEGRLLDASLIADALKVISWRARRRRGGREIDPAAAAVSVYALLRLRGAERLWSRADVLEPLFEVLPDAICIKGERLARDGRHAEALAEFVRLGERGLPFFTDGLTYTRDRLKLYLQSPRPSSGSERLDAAERLFARLEEFSQCVDFGRQLTTFTGLDPRSPDDEEFEGDVDDMEGLDLSGFRFDPSA